MTNADRPMNEYESALFEAFVALGQTLLERSTISESALLNKLSEAKKDSERMGRSRGAATLGLLIKFLVEPSRQVVASGVPTI
jgi:ribosomal 50S subunit-associated protein YjgA (DUF615 family)